MRIEQVAQAIGRGLDIADPLVGNVVEERDLFEAARAALLAAASLAEEAGEQHVALWLKDLADDMEPGR